jgi:hypothetical protein
MLRVKAREEGLKRAANGAARVVLRAGGNPQSESRAAATRGEPSA